jgi:DNA polymerase-3 subunit delta
VTPQLETTVYALTKAVLAHRAADAMRAVDELLAMRVEMPYLMATISGCLIDLQRAAAARRSGKTVQDMMSDFSYRFSFTVENAFRDSMHEAPEQIARCLRLLCRAEMKMHSAAVNERVLLEQTIAEMLQS